MAPKPDRWRYQDPMQVDDSAYGLACAWTRPVSIKTASSLMNITLQGKGTVTCPAAKVALGDVNIHWWRPL